MIKIPKVFLRISSGFEHERGFLRGIAKYSRTHGPWYLYRHINLKVYRDDPKNAPRPLLTVTNTDVDGIITRDPIEDQEILETGIPAILAIHTKEQKPNYPYVIMDHGSIGKMAADFLIKAGFQNFAFYGPSDLFWVRERAKGFEDRISVEGYHVDIYKYPLFSWNKTRGYLEEWLLKMPKTTGLLACNDLHAQYVIEACKNTGLNVPDDIAIMGVDNDQLVCEMAEPPLTSIAINFETAGYEAAALLDRLMNGEKMSGQRIMITTSHVVERQSTDVLAVEDDEVKKAIRFIHKNAKLPIQVNDAVKATSLSRRALERRFQILVKHTILDEIRKARINQIILLISETDMPLDDIAAALGFSGLNNMSRFFYREKGMYPSRYRKQLAKRPIQHPASENPIQ